MLSTPLIWASMGEATASASVSESAPGTVADTENCTGVMVGCCSTGRFAMQTSPARHRMIEMTAAKIGRSMKKCENTGGPVPSISVRRLRVPAAHQPGPVLPGPGHRAPARQPQPTVHDDPLAARQALGDEPVIPVPLTHGHRAALRFVVLVHHPN